MMTDHELFEGLASRFLHDGCHNRAEAICRRLQAGAVDGVGKVWILPSSLEHVRIVATNPLHLSWLVGAIFPLPDVEYCDTVKLHGEEILWRYHVLAVSGIGGDVLVHDPATGSLPLAEALASFRVRSLEESPPGLPKMVWRVLPYGRGLSPADFEPNIRDELLRDLNAESPQSPTNWTPYWLNVSKGPGFTIDSHQVLVNEWHVRLEEMLLHQLECLG